MKAGELRADHGNPFVAQPLDISIRRQFFETQ
jgi:hypothetical protein